MTSTALLEAEPRPRGAVARVSAVLGGEPPAADITFAFGAATAALRGLPDSLGTYDTLDDGVILELQRELAAQRRILDSRAALVAAQIARRSAPGLGPDGLAQRNGYRTAEELVRVSTGATASDARRAVRVGVAVDEAQRGGRIDQITGEVAEPARPWLTAISHAVAAGELSLASADSIANGLGAPTDTITTAMLADAAGALLREAIAPCILPGGAAPLDADRLYRRARELRDEMDVAGIAVREEQRRAERGLRIYRRPGGGSRLVWDMDPETAVVIHESHDQLTSPRRGGPRFIETSPEGERAERILRDGRTTEQLASDGFLELIRIAADVAPTSLIGVRRPSVRVLVPAATLEARRGSGQRAGRGSGQRRGSASGHGAGQRGGARIEGQPGPVSAETADRHACADGTQTITFDTDGQPLDVGREQRLYTHRQRIALAARDGGCRWTGCERPPSWSEAHHIKHWVRDRGGTDVADGILLCRHHHLLLHNNHWEITRDGGDYWLVPPPDVDPEQRPIGMPSQSGALREMMGTQ